MSDDQRVYSDEEFARILRKATDMASRAEQLSPSSTGLTLTEMKVAAAEAGLDPTLIERAALLLVNTANASLIERLIGGPLQHDHAAHFPAILDEAMAAQLLSAIRVRAGLAGGHDVGHSGPMGMTWHDGGQTEALGVTAHTETDGTTVSVVVDRRGTLTAVAAMSGLGMFVTFLSAVFALYPESAVLGYVGFFAGVGGTLAAARGYWASSTRKVRERIGVVMEAINSTFAQPVAESIGPHAQGDRVSADRGSLRPTSETI